MRIGRVKVCFIRARLIVPAAPDLTPSREVSLLRLSVRSIPSVFLRPPPISETLASSISIIFFIFIFLVLREALGSFSPADVARGARRLPRAAEAAVLPLALPQQPLPEEGRVHSRELGPDRRQARPRRPRQAEVDPAVAAVQAPPQRAHRELRRQRSHRRPGRRGQAGGVARPSQRSRRDRSGGSGRQIDGPCAQCSGQEVRRALAE